MRVVCLLVGLLLPRLVWAQKGSHRADYYVRADSLGQRHPAEVRFLPGNEVSLKEPGRRKQYATAASLAFVQSAGRRFYSVEGFEVKPGNPLSRVDRVFVELVDSGRVVLFRYTYTTMQVRPMLVSGLPVPAVLPGDAILYLLQPAGTTQLTPFPTGKLLGGGNYFRTALQPFLAGRPDLLAALLNKRLRDEDLPGIVRALNTNQPFRREYKVPFGVD